MDYRKLITIEPGKRGGKPCIRGLRITVYDVLEYLAAGMSEDEILRDFPDLTREDIRACLAFAGDRERAARHASMKAPSARRGVAEPILSYPVPEPAWRPLGGRARGWHRAVWLGLPKMLRHPSAVSASCAGNCCRGWGGNALAWNGLGKNPPLRRPEFRLYPRATDRGSDRTVRVARRRRRNQASTEGPTDPIDITLIIAGRRVPIDSVQNGVDRAMCRAASNHARRRLGAMRCPEHQQPPRITLSGPSADQLSFTVEGCCPTLIEAATRALHAADPHSSAPPRRWEGHPPTSP